MTASTTQFWLRFQLESDATFGRGDGIPGLIDRDIALDVYGCPYLHGRTLKGLLVEVCADILFALQSPKIWKDAADHLFGVPGRRNERGIEHVGHAQLPTALHATIQSSKDWAPHEITASLTTIRRQTALEIGGAPDSGTLRSMRVILRNTLFESRLTIMGKMSTEDEALLAACVKGLRRAGTVRNRGRGRVAAWLEDDSNSNIGGLWFAIFKQKAGAE